MSEAPARINLELCSGMGRDFYREVGSHPWGDTVAYVRADIVDELRAALEKAREDINWMLNNAKPLNSFVFDYIDAALAKSEDGA